MELGGYGFEKTDMTKTAEDIYSLKGKKQDLELTLSSEKFHYRYIPKRRNLAQHEALSRLLIIIPLTICTLVSIAYVISSSLHYGEADGMSVMVTVFISAFGGYACIRLWKREFHMIMKLWLSLNPDRAVKFSKRFDINTYQSDEALSRSRIEMLEAEIANIDQKISQLEEKRKQLIEQQKNREDFLREKGVLFDNATDETKDNGKFVLKKESYFEQDLFAIYEYYTKEEQYITNYLLQLDGKLQRLNKEIVQIDEDFESVKKLIIFIVLCYVLMILIQSAFSGLLGSITAVICFIISLIVCFTIEKKCAKPIILYLIEHDSELVQEYAFRNSIMPLYIKREEMLETIQYSQKELDEIKMKKRELDF